MLPHTLQTAYIRPHRGKCWPGAAWSKLQKKIAIVRKIASPDSGRRGCSLLNPRARTPMNNCVSDLAASILFVGKQLWISHVASPCAEYARTPSWIVHWPAHSRTGWSGCWDSTASRRYRTVTTVRRTTRCPNKSRWPVTGCAMESNTARTRRVSMWWCAVICERGFPGVAVTWHFCRQRWRASCFPALNQPRHVTSYKSTKPAVCSRRLILPATLTRPSRLFCFPLHYFCHMV